MRMITVCIPTKNRPDFLARLLHYYAATNYRHWIFIGDSSDHVHAERNKKTVESVQRKLKVRYFECAGLSGGAAVEQMNQSISTPYCTLVPDDDFVCTDGLERCIEFMERNPDCNAAHGRGVMFGIDRRGPYGDIRHVSSYPLAELKSNTGAQRLIEHLRNPLSVLSSVHRAENWEAMFRGLTGTPAARQAFIYDEMIAASVSAVRGCIKQVDCLYLFRQAHEGVYRQINVFDWITSPDWFPSYRVFCARVKEELIREDRIGAEEAEAVIKEAFWLYLATVLMAYWHIQYGQPGRDGSKRLLEIRTFARKIPGIQYLWRALRANGLIRNRSETLLSGLLRSSSPFHTDFMPIYRAITEPPGELNLEPKVSG